MDIAIQGCNSGRIPKEKSKMDHPEKLAAQGTQDEEKQNKNTTKQVLDTIVLKTHKQRKEDIRKRK
jgi:hypothetical protein